MMKKSTERTKTIIGLFPELLGVGGIQEAGRLTAAALERIAYRKENWRTAFQSMNDEPGQHEFRISEESVFLRGFGRKKLGFVACAIRESRSLSCIVLAAHPNLALPAQWMKLFSPGLKTIVMSHGIEVWMPLPHWRRRALLSADLVLAPSSDTSQKLAEIQGVPRAKIKTLAWPLNPDFLKMGDNPADLPRPNGFPEGRVILTVGRWAASERYKGLDDLIRATVELRTKFKGLHLVAVGDGDDLPRLQKIAHDLQVSESVRFLTNLSRRELAACYSKCEIFALPSRGEGFGLVFLEAMAFGKPLVGAACGGTLDVVEDRVNGLLVPPNDLEGLIAALARLLEEPNLCKELGTRGGELVHQRYSFEAFEKNLEQILKECGMDSSLSG